jgi:hypothetical protein
MMKIIIAIMPRPRRKPAVSRGVYMTLLPVDPA